MSEATLPEELLKEILKYHFSVSEEMFFWFPHTHPGRWQERYQTFRRKLAHPPSGLLLVSKRWLRIGTPLLYSDVVILEQKHTKAISQLLTANPALGKVNPVAQA